MCIRLQGGLMKRLALTIFLTSLWAVALTGCDENVLKDARDGKSYKIVKIGEQVWMEENLNFEMEDSYCYDDKSKKCKKF